MNRRNNQHSNVIRSLQSFKITIDLFHSLWVSIYKLSFSKTGYLKTFQEIGIKTKWEDIASQNSENFNVIREDLNYFDLGLAYAFIVMKGNT